MKKKNYNESIPFGIGSFIISIEQDIELELEDVVVDLSESLRNIPGLSGLKIDILLEFPELDFLLKVHKIYQFLLF